jgi:hypothetical protein
MNSPSWQTRDSCSSRIRANIDDPRTSSKHLLLDKLIDNHDRRLYVCSHDLRHHLRLDLANLGTNRMSGIVDEDIDMAAKLLLKRVDNLLCAVWRGDVGYGSSDFWW